MNDIAHVNIRTSKPLYFDDYRKNNITGSVIFIDSGTNETVAAGMIEEDFLKYEPAVESTKYPNHGR